MASRRAKVNWFLPGRDTGEAHPIDAVMQFRKVTFQAALQCFARFS
jgi:hypothetical protein